ncbi:hypothetical protein NDJ06_00030 [Vibrio alginolyticus]|uniref:hypothetical protein n=1 Tax=Vibrio alginolyticus TaxID=663 RepID=UPI00215F97E6|nr:hypothetical protein [Vibrio alginolyticus]MCS0183703.1 hypothetical protein [Vibrio alginolyticus]
MGSLTSIFSLLVFGFYGDELVKSPFMTFFAGATTSVFASVIFYSLTNHISDIDKKKSAYLAHRSDLIELTNQSMFELFNLGNFNESPGFLAKYNILTNPERTMSGVAYTYCSYMDTFYLFPDLQQFNRHKSILNRLNRSVIYFDQSVRNELVCFERQLDEMLSIWPRFATHKHKNWLSDVQHKNATLEINDEKNFRQHVLGELEYESELEKYIIHNAIQSVHGFSQAQTHAAQLSFSKYSLKVAFNAEMVSLFGN